MASISDRIVAAVITALNTGTPGGVPAAERWSLAAVQPENLPSIIVFPIRNVPEQVGGAAGPLNRARLTMHIECRAAGTGSTKADAAVDPLYVWVVKALAGARLPDGSGGYLNHDTIEEGEKTWFADQGANPYCLVVVEMTAVYQYLVGDPESRT